MATIRFLSLHRLGAAAMAVAVVGSLSSLARTQTATETLPLIRSGDIQYLGSFNVNSESNDATRNLAYGGHALGMGPNHTLYIRGADQDRLCQITIPEIGETASIVGGCQAIDGGDLGVKGGTPILGGSLFWNGRLIVGKYVFYDGNSAAQFSHQVGEPAIMHFGPAVRVGRDLNPAFYGGYMAVIPEEWRSLFGGPALTGQGILSIIGRTSSGPAAFVFDPDQVGEKKEAEAEALVYYPLEEPLSDPEKANELYTRADQLGGVAFPSGTRSVLFVGRHGMGKPGYGQARCGFQGECSDPYRGQIWAYDANDLLKVRKGKKDPWDVKPYAVWELPNAEATGWEMQSVNRGGAAYDPATRRIYVTGDYGERPRVHVYEVRIPSSPSSPF